jgi:extracellular elastinolytic metalloproteinase
VQAIGEVWANMLHNVYAALVSARGFAEDKLTNPDGTAGNIVFMRLFMDALPLQPCNPTCKATCTPHIFFYFGS